MLTEISRVGDIAVLKLLHARFDASIAPKIKSEIVALIEQGERKLVLDLQCVQFVDSSGLGAMVSIFKALGGKGDIVLCRVAEGVHSMLRLTRMDRVFTIDDDAVAACARLGA